MKNIECEIRSFINEEQYKELIERFKREAEFLGEDDQITYYFDCDEDLRIQKNNNFSKIWLKKGKIHDEQREEMEIKLPKEDFEKIAELFSTLGYKIEIKWFRKRHTFKWDDILVMLDYTKGYGYIIELEKMCTEAEKEKTLDYLKTKIQELNISITSREEFDKKFKHYKENWQRLI